MSDIPTTNPSDALTAQSSASGQISWAQPPTALTEQLDALAKLPTSILRKQWLQFYKTQPPRRMTRDLLLLAVGWRVQARMVGGLSAATKRKLAGIPSKSNQQGTTATCATIRLKPGTMLVREWHGEVHEIMVLEVGFEWRGEPYGSLSKIAKQITGAHWSGPRFFGLKPKPDNFTQPGRHADA